LEGQGIEYRAFYIANKILVRNGDLTLLNQLVARQEVARLTLNYFIQAIEPIINPNPGQNITTVEPNISFVNQKM
jgi:hypothetical protein